LLKSLYSLKKAPKQWYEKFERTLTAKVFIINEADKCVISPWWEQRSHSLLIHWWHTDFQNQLSVIKEAKVHMLLTWDLLDLSSLQNQLHAWMPLWLYWCGLFPTACWALVYHLITQVVFFISMHDSKLISCVFMRRLSVFPTFRTYIKLGLPNWLLYILATFMASDHHICFLSFLLIYLWEEQTLAWLLAPSFFLINDGNHFNLNNNFLLFFLFLLWLKKKKKKIKIRRALFSSFVILLCSFCTL
jgi:hypothetical protein